MEFFRNRMDKYIFYICQAIDQKYFSLLSLQFLWKNQYSFTPLKNNSITGNYKILKELYTIFVFYEMTYLFVF